MLTPSTLLHVTAPGYLLFQNLTPIPDRRLSSRFPRTAHSIIPFHPLSSLGIIKELKGCLKNLRLSMRFRKIQPGLLVAIGELCEVPRCLLGRGLRHHYPLYNVSCIWYPQYMAGYFLDRLHM